MNSTVWWFVNPNPLDLPNWLSEAPFSVRFVTDKPEWLIENGIIVVECRDSNWNPIVTVKAKYHLPIVALVQDGDGAQALAFGADDFLEFNELAPALLKNCLRHASSAFQHKFQIKHLERKVDVLRDIKEMVIFQDHINEVLRDIAMGQPLPTILYKVVETVEKYLKEGHVSILFLDKETQRLGKGIAVSLDAHYMQAIDGLPVGEGMAVCGTAAFRKELVIVENTLTNPLTANFVDIARQYNLLACWSHPVFDSNREILGTFAVYYPTPRKPRLLDLDVIERVSHIVGIAIQFNRSQTILRDSEARHRRVLEDLTDLVVRFDTYMRIEFINQVALDYIGLSLEEALGQRVLKMVKPSERGVLQETYKKLSPQAPVQVMQGIQMNINETVRWIQWTIRAFYNEQGQAVEYQAVGHDVTAQVELQAEQQRRLIAIEDMRSFLRNTLDAFSAHVAVVDADGWIINTNAPWDRFSSDNGLPLSKQPPRINYLAVCDNATGDNAEEAKPAAEGIRQVIRGDRESFYLEYPCHAPHRQQWYSMTVSPFKEEVPRRVIVSHLNITERVLAELQLSELNRTLEQRVIERTHELQKAKDRAEAILNNSLDGILLLNKKMNIQQGNLAFCQLFQCDLEAYFDQPFIHLFDDSAINIIQTKIELLSRYSSLGDNEKRFEAIAKRLDSTCFDAEITVGAIEGDGFVCTIRDISSRKEYERHLQYQASIQESINDAIIVTDVNTCITSWNRAAERIYGYRSDEVLGLNVGHLLQTKYLTPVTDEELLRLFRDVGYWTGEVSQVCKNGQRINVLSSVQMLRDSEGKPYGMVGVNHDITLLKEQERKLLFHASLQRSVNDAVVTTDLNFVIRSWNTGAEKIYGWRADEAIGKTTADLFQTRMMDGASRDTAVNILSNNHYFDDVVIQKRRDGRDLFMRVTLTEFSDEQGQPMGYVGVNRDVSDQVEATLKLSASEERYRLLAEHVTDVIIHFDQHGIAKYVTPSVKTLLGYEADELVGKSAYEYIHPDDRSAIQDMVANLQHQPVSELFYYRFMHHNGSYIWLESQAKLTRDNERIVSARDVTERIRANEALRSALVREQELNELKTRFVSMASHEFRTPLATMMTLTESLMRYRTKMTEESIEQRLQRLQEQIIYLRDIMDDILEIARMQARRYEFNVSVFDLNDLMNTILEEFQLRFPQRMFVFKQSVHHLEVCLDKKLIRSVLSNLISNAIKYSEDTTIVEIELNKNSDTIIIEITDKGIGIPLADQKYLFQPFHRANNVGTTSGTGLGLVITKEAVELHGGSITFKSELNKGTQFTVTLPLGQGLEYDQNNRD